MFAENDFSKQKLLFYWSVIHDIHWHKHSQAHTRALRQNNMNAQSIACSSCLEVDLIVNTRGSQDQTAFLASLHCYCNAFVLQFIIIFIIELVPWIRSDIYPFEFGQTNQSKPYRVSNQSKSHRFLQSSL